LSSVALQEDPSLDGRFATVIDSSCRQVADNTRLGLRCHVRFGARKFRNGAMRSARVGGRTGSAAGGATRLSMLLAGKLPNASFLGLDGSDDGADVVCSDDAIDRDLGYGRDRTGRGYYPLSV
jgi:hypothetical protein